GAGGALLLVRLGRRPLHRPRQQPLQRGRLRQRPQPGTDRLARQRSRHDDAQMEVRLLPSHTVLVREPPRVDRQPHDRPEPPGATYCSYSRYHLTSVRIDNDTTLTLQAIDNNNNVFDTFTLTKGVVTTTTTTTTTSTTSTTTTSTTSTTTTSTSTTTTSSTTSTTATTTTTSSTTTTIETTTS